MWTVTTLVYDNIPSHPEAHLASRQPFWVDTLSADMPCKVESTVSNLEQVLPLKLLRAIDTLLHGHVHSSTLEAGGKYQDTAYTAFPASIWLNNSDLLKIDFCLAVAQCRLWHLWSMAVRKLISIADNRILIISLTTTLATNWNELLMF